ncbi:hypothetical protein EUX98_g8877 [Antrodiella citrinella]|uniref:Prefoldin subunit 6 n=1 Tax=Antrodiella citrinella TaxID=2447956 RepID=A0A4S4M1Z2_9APHY|nr:hypothetical protein EUX98_g9606 [Antrodiella citrinella]THH18905.1 hypothetical protein EUX98_g8877 [Antrodiella citrinella]
MSNPAELQTRLQDLSSSYQKIQHELSVAVDARQKLDAQKSENELVRKEFDRLTPNSEVYKQIGPVLVPQTQEAARGDVEGRLRFIEGNIQTVETQLAEIEARGENVKSEIVEIQTLQRQQAGPTAISV